MPQGNPRNRDNNFDAIRLTAAFMVIAGHMGILAGESAPVFMGSGIQGLGVAVFFIVGGYLITKSWMSDPHPLRFAVKRFFRVIPPLTVYTVFAAFIAGPFLSSLSFRDYFANPAAYKYLSNIALYINYHLPGLFETNPYPNAVNGSLWALPAEVFMYILVPVIITLTGLRKNTRASKIVFAGICFSVIALRICNHVFFPELRAVVYSTSVTDVLSLMPYYMIGGLFAVFPRLVRLCNIQIASVLLLIFSCFRFGFVVSEIGRFIVFSYFIFSLAFSVPPIFAKVFSKCEISYGLFLYGFFFQQTAVWWFAKINLKADYNVYLIFCTALTAVFAYLSFKYVETPCIRFSQKLLRTSFLRKESRVKRQV